MAKVSATDNTAVDNLSNKIEKIESENDIDLLTECISLFEKQAVSENERKVLITDLHVRCLGRRTMIKPIAIFLKRLLETTGDSHLPSRAHWIHLLQENYESRNTLCRTDHNMFLGFVHLHGELYNSLLVNSIPFKVLATPLLDYLFMLLGFGSREDLKLMLYLLTINWKFLMNHTKEGCEKFEVELREQMLRSPKPQILLAIDIIASGFPKGAILSFYQNVLPDECRIGNDRQFPKKKETNKEQVAENFGPPDINAVRQRMQSKGIIPRYPNKETESRTYENDCQFYGIQLQKQRML